MRVRGEHFLSQLLQGSDVVEDPEASPIRGERQIMEALLNGDPVDRRMWQLRLQRLPILSIVKRDVKRVLGAEIEQSFAHGIFTDAVRVAQHAVRNAVGD